jgi:hypothetical protein
MDKPTERLLELIGEDSELGQRILAKDPEITFYDVLNAVIETIVRELAVMEQDVESAKALETRIEALETQMRVH